MAAPRVEDGSWERLSTGSNGFTPVSCWLAHTGQSTHILVPLCCCCCRGRLEILVQNPPDGQELYWHNTRTVPKPYKGPREVRFEQDFSPDHDIKLALTR